MLEGLSDQQRATLHLAKQAPSSNIFRVGKALVFFNAASPADRAYLAAFASWCLQTADTAASPGKLGEATHSSGALGLGVAANGVRIMKHVAAPRSCCLDIGLGQSD